MAWWRWLVRAGGVLQLALVTGATAACLARTFPPVWHDSRPGCTPDVPPWRGQVVCGDAPSVPGAIGWGAFALGVLVALVIARSRGRARRVAQGVVLVVATVGTAVFAADQARYGGAQAMICVRNGHGGCAHPAWTMTSLLVGAAVGLGLGAVSLAGEAGSRRARSGQVEWRRVLRAALVVVAVPTALLGLWARLQLGDEDGSTPWLFLSAAAVLAVVALAVSPRNGDSHAVAPAR